MIATVTQQRLRFRAGQRVRYTSGAGTCETATIVCAADNGLSVFCGGWLYLPVRLYGIKWSLV